jgi:cobalt-zinc-cadmium efflux system outer membrane protein
VALEQRVVEAEARQRLSTRMLAPPEIRVGWLELRDASQSFDGPVVGVSWPLPVFDRNQGTRDVAAAEVDRSRALAEAARGRAQEHADGALAAYSKLYSPSSPSRSPSPSDQVVDSVLAAFDAGEADLTDVIDALRTTVDVQLARLDSLAAALAAGRELEAALGRPILPGGSS